MVQNIPNGVVFNPQKQYFIELIISVLALNVDLFGRDGTSLPPCCCITLNVDMRHLLWGTSSKMVVNVNALLKVSRCQACKETMRKQRCGLVTSSDLFITKRKHSGKYVWSGKGRLI